MPLDINPSAILIASIGVLASGFICFMNVCLLIRMKKTHEKHEDMIMFYYRIAIDIFVGLFTGIFLSFIVLYCIFHEQMQSCQSLVLFLALPSSNIGAIRSIVTLEITIERNLAAYTPIFFHNFRKLIPTGLVLVLAISFGLFENFVLFGFCGFTVDIPEHCVAFGCAINKCFFLYWSTHKATMYALICVSSIFLCVKLFIMDKFAPHPITGLSRVNRLALIDVGNVLIFDFLPSFVAARFQHSPIFSYKNVGPYTAVTKIVGVAVEAYLVYRTLARKRSVRISDSHHKNVFLVDKSDKALIMEANPSAIIISVIGVISSVFASVINLYVIRLMKKTHFKKEDMILFFYRITIDVFVGLTTAAFLSFVVLYCLFHNDLHQFHDLVFYLAFPASNVGAIRSIVTLAITIERNLAAYTPILFRNFRQLIPTSLILALAIVFGIFEDIVLFGFCSFTLDIPEHCVAFGCSVNSCFYLYWTTHKSVIFALVCTFSLSLCAKLFIMDKFGAHPTTGLSRVNRLALIDTSIILLFDFLPSFLAGQFPNHPFFSFKNIGPYGAVTKIVGVAIEAYLVYRTLARNRDFRTSETIKQPVTVSCSKRGSVIIK